MKNNKKRMAILSMVAVLAFGSSICSFAATGWKADGSSWHYYDKDGTAVTNQWKKSGENWYYLNQNKTMETDELIEDGDAYYYVDASGKMVKNEWANLQKDGEEFHWFYFQNTGKAKDNGFLTVDSHKYHFTDSKMDVGWLQDSDHTYYLNTEHDGTYGAMKTGWVYVDDFDEDDDVSANEEGWYYFGTNGRLVTNEEKKIDGKFYVFDENGRMLDNWVEFTKTSKASGSDAASKDSVYKFFTTGNGARKDGWLYLDAMSQEEEGRATEEGWYYFKNGVPYSASFKTTEIASDYGVAKIKGKVYCFDEIGKMVTGKVEGDHNVWFYFDPDSGAMKQGKIRIKNDDDLDDGTYYFKDKGTLGEKGKSKTGVVKGYLYNNGELVEAESGMKYEKVTVKGNDYLVNEFGKIKTSGTVKDGNDVKWTVTKKANGTYTITSET